MRRRIGAGGFATVWLCYDEQLDSPVAVKVLAENWAVDLHVRQRFVEEGRFLRKVESTYVVPVYDAGELDDGRPYLVMAYADQGSLADRLDLAPLEVGQALQVVREVGAGLRALHQRGVLHRDVKPANVLFRSEPREEQDGPALVRSMVGDLGLGKSLDMSSRLSMVAGTPAYVAPEQARGDRLDARADLFSLAAVAYLLLAHRPPFQHASLSAASDRALPSEGSGLAPAADAVLRRGLAPDPVNRYDDITDFVRDLTASLEHVAGAEPAGQVAWLPTDPDATRVGTPPSPLPSSSPSVSSESVASGSSWQPAPTRGAAATRRGGLGRGWLAAAAVVAVLGVAGGWALGREAPADVTVSDENGSLRVTVPGSWNGALGRGEWTPPGSAGSYSALSVGSRRGWQGDPGANGVFLGILPGGSLPVDLPGHPSCTEVQEPINDESAALGPTVTVVNARCAGGSTVFERLIRVADNRLLWVQVQADDRSAATAVLDSVQVSGF